MCRIAEKYLKDPVRELCNHTDVFNWKRTIPHLIKDAHIRNAERPGWEPDRNDALEMGMRLGKKLLEYFM